MVIKPDRHFSRFDGRHSSEQRPFSMGRNLFDSSPWAQRDGRVHVVI